MDTLGTSGNSVSFMSLNVPETGKDIDIGVTRAARPDQVKINIETSTLDLMILTRYENALALYKALGEYLDANIPIDLSK